MKCKVFFLKLCIFLLLFYHNALVAQTGENKLRTEEITVSIDSISVKLLANYVFPHIADKMVSMLNTNLNKGIYSKLTTPKEFAQKITSDLREVSQDKHLLVVYDPAIIAREMALTDEDRENEEAEWKVELLGHLKRDNFGFKRVEILEGNVGYIDLREFVSPEFGGETLSSAMQFLTNTDAIILDLRKNDGGSPLMVQLLASYFFSSEQILLANHYNRPKDELTQSWTLPFVPGTRRPDVSLYILTSNKTFSAAEAISYQLKCLERATIIGETTAGGAHLTGSVIATDKFYVRIPQGRTTSPVTNSNWEGTGVEPDIKTNSQSALEIAHAKALETLKRK